MDRRLILASLLLIGQGAPIACGADEQLIRSLKLWERRAVIVARIGDKQRDTVEIDTRLYNRYTIKVLSSITGSCDPARTPIINLHFEFFESYEIPPQGTVVLIAMSQREKAESNEWLIEPGLVSYTPNRYAIEEVKGDPLAVVEKCRSACETVRRKLVEHRDYRIAELEKFLARNNEKFAKEKIQFDEGLKAALASKDQLEEARVRERMQWANNYYPDVIAVAEKQLAALRDTSQ
jgi:hypothetical protein